MVLFTEVVGVAKLNAAVPEAELLGVNAVAATHSAVPVLVPLLEVGADVYAQVYGTDTDPVAGTDTLAPPVTEQVPPLSIESVILVAVMASQSFGFASVMVPTTFQPLSV